MAIKSVAANVSAARLALGLSAMATSSSRPAVDAKASASTYRVTLLGATGSPIGHANMSACCEHAAVARVKDDFSARGLKIDAVAKKVKP